MAASSDLFEYTSGKWLWNDRLRHVERTRLFNVSELKSLAALSVDRTAEDVLRFEKLAEGGFNRTFLVTMKDGFRMIARIPYPATEPKHFLLANEVATMDYLRTRKLPIPEVYGYSTTAKNPAGTEYIFMEFVRGTNLGGIWFDLGETARTKVVSKLVELESRLFSCDFPASGSLYYSRDLQAEVDRVDLPLGPSSKNARFCIGPETTLGMWFGQRQTLDVFRGPYRNATEVLNAGAQKEIAYLTKYGRPLHPFQRLYRETFEYQRQSPQPHVDNLEKYLQLAPYLLPRDNEVILQPSIRHPDLQPSNIFVSDDLEITGLIDWQHCKILPLFLQGGIPGSFQNYGDEVSESLELPKVSDKFDNLNEQEQSKEVDLLRRRQLHYHYVNKTIESGSRHGKVLTDDPSIFRRKLYCHARDPWEGNNVALKADLIIATKLWLKLSPPNADASIPACPITFPEEEEQECLHLAAALEEADVQYRTCLDLLGAGPEGWVPVEQYEDAKQREQKLRADTLEQAESDEEAKEMLDHWPFADFDEEEYM